MKLKLQVFTKIMAALTVLFVTMSFSLNAQSYDIFFWCSAEGSPMGMSGVDVTIDGVTVTSDFDGLALFPGYIPGSYDYVAHKDGYADVTGSVTVVDQNIQEFVVMSPAYDIFFWCSEEGSPMGMSGVDVTIDGVTVTSDFDGLALLPGYPAGTYDYVAGKDGYIAITGTVTVVDQNIQEFVVMSPGLSIDLTVLLEGPFNGSEMTTELNSKGLIPSNQPYNTAPWNYQGTESGSPASEVVDWVLIEVRDAADAGSAGSSATVSTQAAYLLNDGSVVSIGGSRYLNFANLTIQNSMYVVVSHRNHLSVMSANAVTTTNGIYTYDFNSAGQAYNDGQKNVNGIYVMYGGDTNSDGTVDPDDSAIWHGDAGTGSSYTQSDYNLDGQSDNKDKNDIWVPNINISTQVPN